MGKAAFITLFQAEEIEFLTEEIRAEKLDRHTITRAFSYFGSDIFTRVHSDIFTRVQHDFKPKFGA